MHQGREFPLTRTNLAVMLHSLTGSGASIRFQVFGPSMQPFIKDGDILTISPVADAQIKAGDVVALVHPGTRAIIVHRVVERKRSGRYLIKGDRAQKADGVYSIKHIAGKVAAIERGGRSVRLGSGPERFLIAWLSREGRLASSLKFMKILKRFFRPQAAS